MRWGGERFSWEHRRAPKARKRQRKRLGNREDCGKQTEASEHLALSKCICRFSEMEGGNGSNLTFAQVILELPS